MVSRAWSVASRILRPRPRRENRSAALVVAGFSLCPLPTTNCHASGLTYRSEDGWWVPPVFGSSERTAGLPERNGIFADVFFNGFGARPAADVVERLRILDAVFLAQGTAAVEDEFSDVVAVGGDVVVAQEREPLAGPSQLSPEPGPMIPCRPLGPVRAIGVNDLLDHASHVHDAVDLRPPRVVVLLLDRVRRQSSGKLFGVIMGAARHPASGFQAAGDLGVVGILFVMAPGIPAH